MKTVRAHQVAQVKGEAVQAGYVTLYGVVLGKRPVEGGYLLDVPGERAVFVGTHEFLPVFAKVDEDILVTTQDAFAHERAGS